MERYKLRQGGFSLIEALIGAALISVTALGLGSSINHLMQSHGRSKLISLAISTESALVNAVQDPSNYTTLQAGQPPPSNFQLQVVVDPTNNKYFTISPAQTLYLDENWQPCSGFSDRNCLLKVTLSPWGKDIPVSGQYSLGYSIAANPSSVTMPSLGNKDANFSSPSDYILTVPALSSDGKLVQCTAPNPIGILGVDSAGQALCLYYPDAMVSCKADEIPKGFQVTPDATDTHKFYLSFKCVPMRKISCGNPNYSFENFNPVALDPMTSGQTSAVGKCVYIGAPTTAPITASGNDSMQVNQACAVNYVPNSPTCQAGIPSAPPVTCTNGQVLRANTDGITAQVANSSSTVLCQAVVPTQPCCANDPTKCVKVTVPLTVNYNCVLDSNHGDQWVY